MFDVYDDDERKDKSFECSYNITSEYITLWMMIQISKECFTINNNIHCDALLFVVF